MPLPTIIPTGIAVPLLGLLAALAPAAGAADSSTAPAAAFARFGSLAGAWEGTNSKGEAVRYTYEVLADGTAVLERFHAGPHEMLTVYHLDGDDLMLTHYCAAGNQPRMRAVAFDGDVVRFELVDVSGLDSPDEGYMHDAAFEFDGSDHLDSRWTFRQAGRDAFTETIDIHRIDSASR